MTVIPGMHFPDLNLRKVFLTHIWDLRKVFFNPYAPSVSKCVNPLLLLKRQKSRDWPWIQCSFNVGCQHCLTLGLTLTLTLTSLVLERLIFRYTREFAEAVLSSPYIHIEPEGPLHHTYLAVHHKPDRWCIQGQRFKVHFLLELSAD